jgi:beta-galactosidase
MQLGVTFYPDQWPEDYWPRAFHEIADAGFTLVRFGEQSWNWVEPEEGRFKWQGLDRAMELAQENHLCILLGLATAQAPSWAIRNYPEIRPVSALGHLYPEYGPRPNVCRDNRRFKKLAEHYVRAVVRRYAKHPALAMWQVENEPVYPPLDMTASEEYCFCPATIDAFRNWARARYHDLTTLNDIWGTKFWTQEFSDWSQVVPPRTGFWDAGNPHIYLDWYRFKDVQLKNWIEWEKSIVREYDSEHPVGTNGFLGIAPRVPDHDLLAENMDWYGLDVYPAGGKMSLELLGLLADWWRSWTHGRKCEFHVTELQGGPNVRWGSPSPVSGEDITKWTRKLASHGAKATLYHNWRAPLFGSETAGFGILDFAGRPTERLHAITRLTRELHSLKTPHPRINPDVAIAYLRTSDVETFQEQGYPRVSIGQWEPVKGETGLGHYFACLDGITQLIPRDAKPVDFIFERDLESKEAFKYHTIILPNPYCLKKEWAEKLLAFVRNGGTLLTEARFGQKDYMAKLYEHQLIGLFGLKVIEPQTIVERIPLKPGSSFAFGWRDIIEGPHGKEFTVSLKFADGHPAFIVRKIGEGRLLYACFSIFLSLSNSVNHRSRTLLRHISKYITIS